MVSLIPFLSFPRFLWMRTDSAIAYGDTNLFCTCAPVEGEDSDITGAAAPTPT